MKIVLVGLLSSSLAILLGACGGDSETTGRFPIEITAERVNAGQTIYTQYCASCHGPVAGPSVLDSAPVHGDSGHTWHHPDRLLYEWVLDRPPLATVMPAFRGLLSEQEVLDVLSYIKSNWLPEIQQRQQQGSAQYESQIIEDRAG
ncbi:MAG: cytochrome c [Chloroflexi bacterium]|nr:cytochrome c [Chloroflexota bacterium]